MVILELLLIDIVTVFLIFFIHTRLREVPFWPIMNMLKDLLLFRGDSTDKKFGLMFWLCVVFQLFCVLV